MTPPKRPRTIKFPTPAGAFTRGYRRALEDGVDPLEQLDPVNECPRCGHIPCGCQKAKQAAVPIVKVAA